LLLIALLATLARIALLLLARLLLPAALLPALLPALLLLAALLGILILVHRVSFQPVVVAVPPQAQDQCNVWNTSLVPGSTAI